MRFKKLNESFEAGGYEMIVTIRSGINGDGCSIKVIDSTGRAVHSETYNYGYNASYARKHAEWAEKDHENAIKYKWMSVPPLKPFIGDIIDNLCKEYNINKEDVRYSNGENVFTGTNVSDDAVASFQNLLKEAATTQYIIVGVDDSGNRKFWDSVYKEWVVHASAATKFDDMDAARDEWFDVPRAGMRRIFIPNYDPTMFESLNEGTGADTKQIAITALETAAQGDKHQWAKTAANVASAVPDEFADDMFNTLKEKASDIKLSVEQRKKLADASKGELTEDQLAECDTLGKVLALVDIKEWADKHPGLLKTFVIVVLSIVAIIEPTPVLEVITLVIGIIPAKWLAKILSVLSLVTLSPAAVGGHIANQSYKKSKDKKEEAFDSEKVSKRVSRHREFDNGHVLHDYTKMSVADSEMAAKKASAEDPSDIYYVSYDDIMNPSSDYIWVGGKKYRAGDAVSRPDGVEITGEPINEAVTADSDIDAVANRIADNQSFGDIIYAGLDDNGYILFEFNNNISDINTAAETFVKDLNDEGVETGEWNTNGSNIIIIKRPNLTEGYLPDRGDCPACGGNFFNTKTGFCKECGYSEELTDPAEEDYETDVKFYVYDENDDVVSDSFEFDEDAIEWAQEEGYPTVKAHNYFIDSDGTHEPDGNPVVVWKA